MSGGKGGCSIIISIRRAAKSQVVVVAVSKIYNRRVNNRYDARKIRQRDSRDKPTNGGYTCRVPPVSRNTSRGMMSKVCASVCVYECVSCKTV